MKQVLMLVNSLCSYKVQFQINIIFALAAWSSGIVRACGDWNRGIESRYRVVVVS
jgi:hypothetical protein